MRDRKIQIYGTFGPACKSQEILKNMIQNGMTGMRLNLSHTTLEKSKEYIDNYRLAAADQGIVPQILIDMQGPELRIGDMEEVSLKKDNKICFISIDQSLKMETAGSRDSKDGRAENLISDILIPDSFQMSFSPTPESLF